MMVQGSPTQSVKSKNPLSGDTFKMPRPEIPDERTDERTEGRQDTKAKNAKTRTKSRWAFSNLLVGQCPEYLVSFSQGA